MAVIGSIRKHSTILLIIVALALLAFLLGDFARKGNNNKIYDKFISVGNEDISYFTYMNKYDQYREIQKANNEGHNLSTEEDFRLGMQVYDELIDSVIFAKQAGYLGITITPEELRDLVAGPNPHQMLAQLFSDGTGYSMQIAQQFLDNIENYDSALVNYYMQIENYIEKETFHNKYLNLLSGAYYMPKAFAQKVTDEASLKADLEVVQIPYSSELVSDDKISFKEADLKKCYEENKYRFKQDEEYRDVEYVIFNIEPSETDLKNIEEDVHQLFEEFTKTDRPDYFVNRLVDSRYDSAYVKRGVLEPGIDTLLFDAPVGTFVEPYIDGEYWKFAKLLSSQIRPDSINVSFIVIGNQGTQNSPRKKEDSQKLVDTAYAMVMMGADFYTVAKQYSDQPIPEDPALSRIWIEDGSGSEQMFFDTLYKSAPGSIVKYEMPYQTYIFKINERTSMEHKIRVAMGRKQIAASKETINNIESAANNFVNGTDTYQKFADAVVANNLNKRTNDRLVKMSYTLPGIREGGREVVRWIFDKNTEKGTVSHVFSLEDMYVVVVLKDIYPEGYRTLAQEQVRTQIEAMVKRDKKAEKLEEILKQALAANTSLNTIATNNNTTPSTVNVAFSDRNFGHYGPEIKVIGKIFGGSSTGKTEVLKGEMGVYAVKVNKIDVPTLDATNANNNNVSMMIQQNTMMYQNRVVNNGTRALRKMYKIKDNMSEIKM